MFYLNFSCPLWFHCICKVILLIRCIPFTLNRRLPSLLVILNFWCRVEIHIILCHDPILLDVWDTWKTTSKVLYCLIMATLTQRPVSHLYRRPCFAMNPGREAKIFLSPPTTPPIVPMQVGHHMETLIFNMSKSHLWKYLLTKDSFLKVLIMAGT